MASAKKENEPGFVDFAGLVSEEKGCHERDGNDPQRACELDGRGDFQRLLSISSTGADDGRNIMNGDGRPGTKLVLRHMEGVSQYREDEQGDGIENEYRTDRDRDFGFLCLDNRCDGGNRAAA